MLFVNRETELRALDGYWRSGKAELIAVSGRRRVGKTYLLDRFQTGKATVYHRCRLEGTPEQLARLGPALATMAGDSVLVASPPTSWDGVFATIERIAARERLMLVLDEMQYWVSKDESVPSVVQNWWDEVGHRLDIMVVVCGSAVQMMEELFSGRAPMAGCLTGQVVVRPLTFRAAAELLPFQDPTDSLIAYGILGGIPLYLTQFRTDLGIRENVARAIASPHTRLYVEPRSIFAESHRAFNAPHAMAVLRAIAQRNHTWSSIREAAKLADSVLVEVMDRLTRDLGLVERLLPVTERHETRNYHTRYRITDNFFLFWFRFIESDPGGIEWDGAEQVTEGIMAELSEYMGGVFEDMCRDWTALANVARALPVRLRDVGQWWNANHQVDVVGVDERRRVILTGEAKWTNRGFGMADLETYLGHVRAMTGLVSPGGHHVLFSKDGFTEPVQEWARRAQATLCTPVEMLAPFQTNGSGSRPSSRIDPTA